MTEIQKEINTLEKQLEDVKGRKTEIYSRIVGYFRPVENWNAGKKTEFMDRNVYSLAKATSKSC